MKAGIITFHYAHHYGAQLQAYALMKAVMRTGVDCEIIDYVRKDNIEGSRLFKKGFSARTLLSNADTLLNYSCMKRRSDRFNSFVKNDMKLSERSYREYAELEADVPRYDIYVCGSDQVWNPLIFEEKTFDPAFFAAFASEGRKVAYAPSFGISQIPEDKREELKRYLMSFDALSVREKQGEKIIEDVCGKSSVTVLDPTLLLTGSQWGEIAKAPSFDKPYLLCYFVSDGRKYSDYVNILSERYKLPVVALCGSRRVPSCTKHKVLDAGPEEFLGLFKNAAMVCTDSFHGTVFSINFTKEFVCFSSSADPEKSVNSRLYNILSRLGITAKLYPCTISAQEFKGLTEKDERPINYDEVEKLLSSERRLSEQYLERSLRADI